MAQTALILEASHRQRNWLAPISLRISWVNSAQRLSPCLHEHISTGSFKLNADSTIQDHLTADQRGRLSNYADGAGRLAISPDGRTVLTSDATYRGGLWDLQSGTLLHLLQGHASFVESVAFSPDGKTVLTGSDDRTAILWNARTGQLLHQLQGHMQAVGHVAYAPDGKSVVTSSSDHQALIWDVQSGIMLQMSFIKVFAESFR